jgi:hypothetical protein
MYSGAATTGRILLPFIENGNHFSLVATIATATSLPIYNRIIFYNEHRYYSHVSIGRQGFESDCA